MERKGGASVFASRSRHKIQDARPESTGVMQIYIKEVFTEGNQGNKERNPSRLTAFYDRINKMVRILK